MSPLIDIWMLLNFLVTQQICVVIVLVYLCHLIIRTIYLATSRVGCAGTARGRTITQLKVPIVREVSERTRLRCECGTTLRRELIVEATGSETPLYVLTLSYNFDLFVPKF